MTVLETQARAILRGNDRGGYTVPTEGLYPYQWNWDSAFAALGFAEFDMERAWVEIETLMAGQWASGMVPHILFHKIDPGYFPGPDVWQGVGAVPSSGVTQPPVAMSFAVRLWQQDKTMGAERLHALWPGLLQWADWFMAWRCHNGCIYVTHPWESGRDNAPCWDSAMAAIEPEGVGEYQRRDTSHVDADMRPTKKDYDRYIWLVQRGARVDWDEASLEGKPAFRVLDPTMHFTLLRGLRDLLEAGRELGLETNALPEQIATLEAGAAQLKNPNTGWFDSYDAINGTWTGALTNAVFLCWYAGLAAPEMYEPLREVLDAAPYGVPSLDPRDPRFDAKRYWRGPSWIMMNMMIAEGLAEQGAPELATEIRQASLEMIRKAGFMEYFDPTDGAPAGGGTFTWTAAVLLTWIMRGEV